MLKLLVKSVVLSACMYGLVGCGGGGMPSCSDKDVKEALQDKFKQEFEKEGAKQAGMPDDLKDLVVKNTSFDFDSFITESSDEKAKKVTCKAKAKIKMKTTDEMVEKMFEAASKSAGVELSKEDKEEFKEKFGADQEHEQEGKYTAQRTDDGKIVIELLEGFKP